MTSAMKLYKREENRVKKGWREPPMTMSEYFASMDLSRGSKRAWKKKKRAHLLERKRRAHLKRRRI